LGLRLCFLLLWTRLVYRLSLILLSLVILVEKQCYLVEIYSKRRFAIYPY
jgi:hypothetical protein